MKTLEIENITWEEVEEIEMTEEEINYLEQMDRKSNILSRIQETFDDRAYW